MFVLCNPCLAKDHDAEAMLSVISLAPQSATQVKVTSILGTPGKIEESKKRILWYYSRGKANLVISWSKKSDIPEKFSFTSEAIANKTFDKSLSSRLKSGSTDLVQALKILGTPKDMTIKLAKQEMYYSFQNKMLRLFFRDRKLVDYCLY